MFDDITTFSFPTRILFGCGAVRRLPSCLEETGVKKPLIVTDPGVRRTPVFDAVAGVLREAGVAYEVFDKVHGNPVEDDLLESAGLYRTAGCDGAVGLGGGSALDVSKAVPVMARHQGPLAELEAQAGGMARINGPYHPVIAIPTTAGTGSEVGRSSVITSHALGRKIIIFSPWLLPQRAILDPELTVTLPPALTAATGMDAFTHCLESLTCPTYHPLCDAIAIHGLEMIIRYLERAVKNGSDIEARGNMQVAATMGAIAFQKDLGATHSLAHPLSTVFGLNHGLANALCLPAVMRFSEPAAVEHYSRLATMFGAPAGSKQAVAEVEKMIARLGITAGLRNHGIPRESLNDLSEKAFEDSCHKTNVRPCTREDLLTLYEQSW